MGETKEVGGGGGSILFDGGENGSTSPESILSRVSADMSGRAWYDERRGRFNGDDSLADENDICGC